MAATYFISFQKIRRFTFLDFIYFCESEQQGGVAEEAADSPRSKEPYAETGS